MLEALITADVDRQAAASLRQQPSYAPKRALFDVQDLDERLKWAESLSGETAQSVRSALERAAKVGPMRRLASVPMDSQLDELRRDFPHCAAVIDLIQERCVLSRCSPAPAMSLPPLLLTGSPGVGKTELASRIARVLDVPVRHIDMASLHSAFSVVGLDAGYATGRPGTVWEALDGPCMAPVIVLDEIDKAASTASEDPTSFLYTLLEPLTACRFIDAALGLSVDASRIMWIATSNDDSRLHPAIRSRFTVLEVDTPTRAQMKAIVASVHRAMFSDAEWASFFEPTVPMPVMDALTQMTPRQVRRALERAYARAATQGRRQLIPEDVQQEMWRVHRIGFI
jgi:ATP-dependent Lon protease